MNYLIGLLGMWVFADGVASIWQYTKPEFNGKQTWKRDHSFRCVRCIVGIVLMSLGYLM